MYEQIMTQRRRKKSKWIPKEFRIRIPKCQKIIDIRNQNQSWFPANIGKCIQFSDNFLNDIRLLTVGHKIIWRRYGTRYAAKCELHKDHFCLSIVTIEFLVQKQRGKIEKSLSCARVHSNNQLSAMQIYSYQVSGISNIFRDIQLFQEFLVILFAKSNSSKNSHYFYFDT